MLYKKKKVNQSNDYLLEGVTIVQFLDFSFFCNPYLYQAVSQLLERLMWATFVS